jgi:hypothetical protein
MVRQQMNAPSVLLLGARAQMPQHEQVSEGF